MRPGGDGAVITAADIERAQKILRAWRDHAKRNQNKKAQQDVEHIMRVLDGLYTGG